LVCSNFYVSPSLAFLFSSLYELHLWSSFIWLMYCILGLLLWFFPSIIPSKISHSSLSCLKIWTNNSIIIQFASSEYSSILISSKIPRVQGHNHSILLIHTVSCPDLTATNYTRLIESVVIQFLSVKSLRHFGGLVIFNRGHVRPQKKRTVASGPARRKPTTERQRLATPAVVDAYNHRTMIQRDLLGGITLDGQTGTTRSRGLTGEVIQHASKGVGVWTQVV